MKTLNQYCRKNIVANEWLKDYGKIKRIIKNILSDEYLDEDVFSEYEDLVLDMDTLFEHIKTSPGFKDWFVEFVENQLYLLNGMLHFYLKHYEKSKNGYFISLFSRLNNDLLEGERNLPADI